MKPDDKKANPLDKTEPVQPQTTTPAEEWGERIETGRDIARGGDSQGAVPGATGNDDTPRSGK